MRSWLSGLRFRLMVLVIIAMVPVSLLMLTHIISNRNENISEIKNDGLKTAELSAAGAARIVEGCRQLLISLSYSRPFVMENEQAETRLLQNIKEKTKEYLMIGICNPEGLVISSSVPTDKKIYVNDREWFKRMQVSRNFSVGDYQVGRITGKPGITLGYPIINGNSDSKPPASVYVALNRDVISSLISRVNLPKGCLVNLVDRKGIIIARNPDVKELQGKLSLGFKEFRRANKKPGEYVEAVGTDGIKRLFTFEYVAGSDNGLFVGIGLSLDQIYADTRKDMITGLILLGLSMAVAFVFIWFITGFSIIRHVRMLVNATKMLAGGNAGARAILKGGTREMKELAISFNEMAGSLEIYSKNLEQLVAERTAELETANKNLFESEELFRLSFENASVGKSLIRPDGIYLRVNQAFCDLLGYTPEELQNMNFADITHPDDIASSHRAVSSLFSGEVAVIRLEKRYIRKDGQIVWVELSSVLLRDKESKPLYLITHIIDINERKWADAELKERDERFRKLSSQVPGMIYEFLKKPDGTYCIPFATNAIEDIFGCSARDVRNDFSPIAKVILPDDISKVIGSIEYSAKHMTPWLCEFRVQVPDKPFRWILGQSKPEKLSDGSVYWYGFATDITERKLSEDVLFASEERFRIAAGSASDLIWEWNIPDGSLQWFGAVDGMLGYEQSEFPRTIEAWEESIHPDDRDRVKTSLNLHIEKGTPYNEEYLIRHKDGTYGIWSDRGDSVRNAKGTPVKMIGTSTDITRLRHDQEALKISEENYRTIFDTANDAIFIHDLEDGRILDVNRRMYEMYSYTREEALKLDIEAVSEGKPPYSQKYAAEKISAAKFKGPQLFEWKAKDKSGNIFWVEVNLKLTVIGGKEVVIAIVRDIEERKKNEEDRLKLEKQLNQSQKLESLGVLAGGIAHDFNNILMAILGNSELGLMHVSDGSPLRARFEAINKASLRASEICKQMLAYSGKGRFMIQTIDLTDVIREMMPMLEVSVSKNALLDYSLADGLPLIEADRSQMQQIIMNLVINASEAIGEKSGVINISTGFIEIDRKYLDEAQLENDLKEGNYVYLEIADTGCGIDSTTLSRIFDPFFSTKFTGRGLGLPAVHGIIRGHKGGIKIISEPGKGTIFRVMLPAVTYQAEQTPITKKKEEVFAGSGTILLVDDEESIRSLGRVMLERMGFSVYSAADGREAVDIFRKNRDRIICVLLDLTMPNMGGEETFRELRIIRSDIPIIISSGYNEDEVKSRFTGMNLSGFIQKPYHMNALMAALKKVIE
jgi:two-component system, cell cycle sensor histidine kinase and response regulator CckA